MAGYIGKSQGVTLLNVESNTVETADIQDGAVTAAKLDQTYVNFDSSGNVGIGTTSPQKPLQVNGDDTAPVRVVRETSDGHLIQFYKDTTIAGYIGYTSDGFYIDGEGNHTGIRFGGGQLVPKDAGVDSDGGVDLGFTSGRFKDLYLSGGVYLGGTGSANYLDDYEEGTWTPTLGGTSSNPTASYYQQRGYYTKIGNLVHFECFVQTSSTSGGSGNLTIQGLPFTVANVGSWDQSVATVIYHYFNRNGTDPQVTGEITNNDTRVVFIQSYDNSSISGVSTTALTADGSWVKLSGNYRAV